MSIIREHNIQLSTAAIPSFAYCVAAEIVSDVHHGAQIAATEDTGWPM